ncbi:MAG: protease pro-enzyme activation domain-containing protein [Thermoplasmata archaeon]
MALVTVVVVLSLLPTSALTASSAPSIGVPSTTTDPGPVLGGPLVLAPVAASDIVPAGAGVIGGPGDAPLPILLTLELTNRTALGALLAGLSDPVSAEYHQYVTAARFEARFSPSRATWNGVLDYLAGFEVSNLTTTPDRVSVWFDATPAVIDAMFHTTLETFDLGGDDFVAPLTNPELPSELAGVLTQVTGLSTYSQYTIHTASVGRVVARSGSPGAVAAGAPSLSYLAPVEYDGAQLEYAPDFQVAYDEQSLFAQYGYPTNATVATILWAGAYSGSTVSTPCGTVSTGEDVGPFVPADVYGYFNETLPAGEPHPRVTAVPIGSAAGASCAASWDSTGAVGENTLDLEMVGSTAPGSQIYNVYGPTPSETYLDAAFATVLSPPLTLSAAAQAGLSNVTVITNSWGESDTYDSNWYQYLEQAQARGISVLASSGDSGDNPSSSKYLGSTVEFPSSMSYNAFGMTAVGGTTPTLSSTTYHLTSQVVWNITAADVSDDGPAGSTGGVSTVYPEPIWQTDTEANDAIGGAGRGVPDLAAIANNTLATLSVDGYQYRATNASGVGQFYSFWGTSIASPLTAGLLADIDYVLSVNHTAPLGFLNPSLYSVANREYAPLPNNATGIGAEATGAYIYSLPTTPFSDVTLGSNYVYDAAFGYDLVTGWGSLDAYNYTMYVKTTSSAGDPGRLSGIQDRVHLAGLSVSSAGKTYNASTQQNFFLANSLGAPVYWVQNVVYISGEPGAWSMRFTGWVVFPFYAAYPSLTVYEYNWPATSLAESTPIALNFTTQLVDPGGLGAAVTFSFGVAGASTLTLPVPGASFLIGSLNYTYTWQGTSYTNGGPSFGAAEGFLTPQFGLVGGPSLGVGEFAAPTAGTVSAYTAAWGSSVFVPAGTATFTTSASQTAEVAANLEYTPTSGNNWTISVQSGSGTQGVLAFESGAAEYAVQFNQTGVPAGTTWWVNVTGGPPLSGPGSTADLVTDLTDGSYPWTFQVGSILGTASAGSGTVTVSGAGVFVDLTYDVPTGTVTFSELGLASGATWRVAIGGGPTVSGATIDLTVTVEYGAHSYRIQGPDATWQAAPRTGTVSVGSSPSTVAVAFTRVVYVVTFAPSFSGTGAVEWWASFNGTTVPGDASNIPVELPNGTYDFSFTTGTGYSVSPTNESLTVTGAPLVVAFVVSPSSPGGLFGLGTWGYLLVGGIVVVLLGVVIAAVATRRKSPPTGPGT